MRKQIEGSRAIAETVARCRPQVVPAYPITPQTHIVEGVGAMVKTARCAGCEFITVESEFAAMSAAIGASAAGARTYTATASQGLLYMAEALFNASGLGLPIVMTVANRAIGAPINIWNDHSDSMSQRDCGWVQLYAEDNQEAVGLHVLAFRLAEQLSRAGDGVRGRVRAHPRVRADRGAEPGARSTRFLPAVRAAPGARPGRAGDDRRDGRARGVHRGALPRRTTSCARRRAASRCSPTSSQRDRGRRARDADDVPHRGRPDRRRDARLGGRHRPRRGRRSWTRRRRRAR